MRGISEKYFKTYGNMWYKVDNNIKTLIISHTKENDKLLEVGFGSGHYLASISEENRVMTGVEIRKEAYNDTKIKLSTFYSDIELIEGDVLLVSGKYDLVYSTGLLQCINPNDRRRLLKHLAGLSDKAIFTVPRINDKRNDCSKIPVGVDGCVEYDTGDLAYELSVFYAYVEKGMWLRENISLKDDFIWFYCDCSRVLEGK